MITWHDRDLVAKLESDYWDRLQPDLGLWRHDVTSGRKTLKDAMDEVIGEATRKRDNVPEKQLPIDFFYALFTFTNLDNLAFEIEEATFIPNGVNNKWLRRARHSVRRDDMEIPETSI